MPKKVAEWAIIENAFRKFGQVADNRYEFKHSGGGAGNYEWADTLDVETLMSSEWSITAEDTVAVEAEEWADTLDVQTLMNSEWGENDFTDWASAQDIATLISAEWSDE